MLSVIIRVLGAVIGVGMLFTMIMTGHFPLGVGRYGWLMPLMPIVFIVYAISGQKIFHLFSGKEKPEKSDKQKLEKK